MKHLRIVNLTFLGRVFFCIKGRVMTVSGFLQLCAQELRCYMTNCRVKLSLHLVISDV